MVLALVGDSTTATSMRRGCSGSSGPRWRACRVPTWRLPVPRSTSPERYPVPGVAVEPALQLELEQHGLDLGEPRVAAAHQLVDAQRLLAEIGLDGGQECLGCHVGRGRCPYLTRGLRCLSRRHHALLAAEHAL